MGQSIGIIGAGGWGTALSKLLCEKGFEVTLWCHGEKSYQEIREKRENRSYLPGIALPISLNVTRSIQEAAFAKELLICTLPSHGVREVMRSAASHIARDTVLLCGTKGIEEGTFLTMGEVLSEILGESKKETLAFLSGPTFAAEVAQGLPTAVTVATVAESVGRKVQETLSTQSFRVYTSKDIVGVQMNSVVKNMIAIARD